MNKTEAITERCTAKQLSSFDVRNFENYLQRSLFFQQSCVQKLTNLLKKLLYRHFSDLFFTFRITRAPVMQGTSQQLLRNKSSNNNFSEFFFIQNQQYLQGFFLFHFYELFLKVAFLRIHGHFALMKVKIRNVLLIMSQS